MTERVFRFGPAESLLGVLTEPAGDRLRPDAPAVLWLNAGILHHAGPFGWYVTLARQLAGHGFYSLRMDLAGIGDSPARDDRGAALDPAVTDVTEAMDFLARKREVRRFVLAGLCWGALLAHRVAVQDPRVVGACLIDGYGYRTRGYHLRHYARRALRPRSWLGAARRLVGARANPEDVDFLLSDSFYIDFPPRDRTRAELLDLVGRDVRLLFLYTGGVGEDYFNHRRQFHEMFGELDPTGDHIAVEYAADADHLFAAHDHRQAMFARVESWVQQFVASNHQHATL